MSPSRDTQLTTAPGNLPARPARSRAFAIGGAASGLAGVTLWLIGGPSWTALVLALGGFGTATVIFLASFLRQYSVRPATLADSESGRLEQLQRKLTHAKYNKPTEKEATRASEQFRLWTSLQSQYSQVLSSKFETGELAAARYQGAALTASQIIRENLELSAQHLGSLEHAVENPSPTSPTVAIRAELDAILALNDRTLMEWQKVLTALSSIRTSKEGFTDPESTLKELEDLAKRAKSYSLK